MMWKRLNNPKGTQQPSYTETAYDENSYGGSHGLGIQVHSPTSPPARPQRDDMGSKGLPSLPLSPYEEGVSPPSSPEFDARHRAAAKKPVSFGDRVRKLASNAPEAKPQWKGASGRVTLVPTPEDKFDVQPLNIPKRDPQRVVSPISEQPTPVSPSPQPRIVIEKVPASSHNDGSSQYSYTATPRSKISRDPPTTSPIFDSEIADHARASENSRTSPVETKQSPVSPVEEIVDNHYKRAAPPPQSYVQPASRFSVSTYATSEARSTPRPSTDTFDPTYEHPPLPSPTPSFVSQSPDSVLNRVRPKVGPGPDRSPSLTSDDSVLNRVRPKVGPNPRGGVTRKAVSTASPVFISMSKRASRTGKTLPITPAEVESQDLVSSLQAQLDDLQHRKNNIMRSIRQMTELMPADNITLTNDVRRKREIEKKKVEGLREEEADVTLQIREIGLRLHRAWKRKDKEAVYEPTGLWVRRVTG
ncbi:hypothetical protein M7I_2681 [Glarea lozoyensis 74030]|uniref:Uncharacterized protein n=1 Tax=Glarea lozoyensis (strain ATCC 74030 / MF5533) TaxID=1104152 RepID=H0EJF5_GLAL7|nr:hypothetical protein M7I_2681 [Glarea lozoyensis 74030]